MYSTSIMTHATVSSKSAAHNPNTFSSPPILLQQSYIVIFMVHHPVVNKVDAISIVAFAECSSSCMNTDPCKVPHNHI